jgi:hypothetical protein
MEVLQVPSRSMGPVVLGENADMRAMEIFRHGSILRSSEITRVPMKKGWAVITIVLNKEPVRK